MYNSTRLNDSSRNLKIYTSTGNNNDTFNEPSTSFNQPRITSTPLQSRRINSPATPTRSSNVRTKRYSLSEVNDSSLFHNGAKNNTTKFGHNLSGNLTPLSNRYSNAHLRAYVDTKSPGYAGRIVQYNEEQEKSLPTHQKKYGSPGVFPIVHLFKKNLPALKRRPNRVTVRIASPDLSQFNSPEHNRMLLEKLVQSNNNNANTSARSMMVSHNPDDISTRSVLDALKEISRKRIHASEEGFETAEETGKRMRFEQKSTDSGESSKKRQRDESLASPESAIIINGNSKKLCLLNELIASQTSMQPYPQRTDIENQSRTVVVDVTSPPRKLQKQVADVETQTITTLPSNTAIDPELSSRSSTITTSTTSLTTSGTSTKEISPTTNDNLERNKKVVMPVLKVFDDKPLESIRKKRLAILMGTFTGGDEYTKLSAATTPAKSSIVEDDNNSPKSPDKPLISILSVPHKTPHTKHVTFNLPATSTLVGGLVPVVTTTISSLLTTQTSSAIVSPLTSTGISAQSVSSEDKSSTTNNTGLVLKESIGSNNNSLLPPINAAITSGISTKLLSPAPAATTPSASLPIFNFNNSLPSGIVTDNSNKSDEVKNAFVGQNSGVTPSSVIELPQSLSASTTSPPKVGGFKFDLNNPSKSSSPPKTTSSFMFNTTTATSTSSNITTPFTFGAGSAKSEATAATTNSFFGSTTVITTSSSNNNSALNVAGGGFNFTTTTGSSDGNLAANTPTSFNFGGGVSTISAAATASSNNLVKSPNNNIFAFGSNKQSSAITTTSSSSIFGTASGFSPAVTTAATPLFGSISNNNPVVSTPINTDLGFSGKKTVTTTISSGVPSNPSSMMFGSVKNNPATTQAVLVSFNNTPTVSSASSTLFGSSHSNNNLDKSSFAADHSSFFSSMNSPTFGSTTVTSGSGFGTQSTPSFVRPSSSATFSTPSSSGFGGTQFGTTTTSSLHVQATPTHNSFGAGNNSTVVGKSLFGAGSGTPVVASSPFGGGGKAAAVPNTAAASSVQPPPPSFGNSANVLFGGGANTFSNTAPKFGGSNNNTAITTTTASVLTFGNNSSTTFAAPFGSTSANNAFGSNNNNNNNPSPAFGTPSTTTSISGFQSSNSTANTNTSGFGSVVGGNNAPTNIFGSAATGAAASTTSGNFAFNQSSPSTFGLNSVPPSFGNSNASSTTNMFGSGGGFGSTATATPSGFAKPSVAQNNSFGGGSLVSSPPSFGNSNNNNSFGQTSSGFGGGGGPPNQVVGANNSGVFTFGSSNIKQPGVFSFGGGGGETVAKPNFNFSSGNVNANSNNNTSFGGGGVQATASFGAVAPPAFGAGGVVVPNLNNPNNNNGPGMFSIGSGPTSSNRTRTQLKAKRRT